MMRYVLRSEWHVKTGLFANDELWKLTLWQSFRSSFVPLSKMFVIVLATCSTLDPAMLWTNLGSQFVSDIRRWHKRTNRAFQDEEAAKKYVLSKVQKAFDRLRDGTLNLYGHLSPPRILAPLEAQQNEDENVFVNLLLDAIEEIAKFGTGQKIVFWWSWNGFFTWCYMNRLAIKWEKFWPGNFSDSFLFSA